MQALGLTCVALCSTLMVGQSAVMVDKTMKSFSSAIKGGHMTPNVEYTLYERNTGVPGVITEQWFTGAGVFDENAVIRYYFDGETEPGLELTNLYMAHGIGYNDSIETQYTPWATKRIGHNAGGGGLFNTFRIPFQKSVKVTATVKGNGAFWYIIRGVENYPLIFGDLQLPSSARLKLYKNENVLLTPLEFITLANVTESAGAVFMIVLAAQSSDFNYLEACFRMKVDGESGYQFLSSGTEDFFLSAYYFDRGTYHDDDAGCTYTNTRDVMSAYKLFETDPLLFTESMELVWRCGEEQSDASGCPSSYPQTSDESEKNRQSKIDFNNLKLADTYVTTYTFIYEYTL